MHQLRRSREERCFPARPPVGLGPAVLTDAFIPVDLMLVAAPLAYGRHPETAAEPDGGVRGADAVETDVVPVLPARRISELEKPVEVVNTTAVVPDENPIAVHIDP